MNAGGTSPQPSPSTERGTGLHDATVFVVPIGDGRDVGRPEHAMDACVKGNGRNFDGMNPNGESGRKLRRSHQKGGSVRGAPPTATGQWRANRSLAPYASVCRKVLTI